MQERPSFPESQSLALKYFAASVVLFGIVVVAGLLAAIDYAHPQFLYPVLPFSILKILHIDVLIIWILMAFMGALFWLIPAEYGRELVGLKLANVIFWIFCATVLVVAAIFVFVQFGPGTDRTLWLINQGRKYVEEPRWAAIIVAIGVAVFVYNIVGTAVASKRVTGVVWVVILNLVPLFFLYLIAFPAPTNISVDQFWWWWLVHFWVEATWEVMIGSIVALVLMRLMGTSRRIVETWLYIEVALVLATGVLGIGHHYFWMGAPAYWLGIGGFFSALEPLPLLGMVVHAVYDAGEHHMKMTNEPAFYWMMAEAFGNFIGAGIFGFMITLPQINLFAHGTQWTASHGHFAMWGAYGCGVISVIYLALQDHRRATLFAGATWKWAFALLNGGMIGMVGSLMMAGMAQAFYERAIGGSTFNAFVSASSSPWFIEGLGMRLVFAIVFAAGYFVLAYDLLTIGKRVRETSRAGGPARAPAE
ncbi:nitric-oxide reductase [bacterium]|nr:MAG: nitric-oxide reductase [bacterium]